MLRKALKSAIGVAIGITIGGCALPRICFPNLYNETWPPLWKQIISYFVVGYVTAFLVFLIINWVLSKRKR